MSDNGSLGELPEGWAESTIGELVQTSYGKSLDKSLRLESGPIPVVGSAGLMAFTNEALAEGEIIVVGRKGNVGDVQYFDNDVWPIDTVYFFSVPESLNAKYFFLNLCSKEMRKLDSSTSTPSLRREDMERVKIEIPPLAEQERIVEVLEEQLSRLDAALASVHVVREKAAQFRRSLLYAAFTGTLTGHNPADGQLPEGWVFSPLKPHIQSRSGDSKIIKGKQQSKPAAGLIQGFSASGPDVWVESAQYETAGVVVSAVGARCGKTFLAQSPWTAIANTHALIPDEDIDVRFLWHLSNREEWWIKSGTAQPFVKVKDTLERSMPIPPLAEQERIVEILEEQLSRLDAALVVADAIEKRSAALRRSLLYAAFTGRLTEQWRESVHV